MKIILTGGTGFLGRPLRSLLASHGHEVVVVTRGPASRNETGRLVTWDPTGAAPPDAPWTAEVDGADAVINLAGDNLADKRWTAQRKETLRRSRILTTRSMVAAIRAARRKPRLFISASAVGYYGDTGEELIDESFPPGSDFMATLCVDWEAEAHAASALGCRVAIVRAGVVLARDGSILKRLVVPFKFFVGGPVASGRQYISWIHRDDWLDLIGWIMDRPEASGAINATAPNPVTNEEFSTALGRVLGRPSWLRVPRLALRVVFGELADDLLVGGQRVLPRRALELGFRFKYERVEEAMRVELSPGLGPRRLTG
jgi:uncharacterized protein (TIGR01777 family)